VRPWSWRHKRVLPVYFDVVDNGKSDLVANCLHLPRHWSRGLFTDERWTRRTRRYLLTCRSVGGLIFHGIFLPAARRMHRLHGETESMAVRTCTFITVWTSHPQSLLTTRTLPSTTHDASTDFGSDDVCCGLLPRLSAIVLCGDEWVCTRH